MKTLYLLRGLPGSGKTSFVKAMQDILNLSGSHSEWFEADHYFYNENGEYLFDPTCIGVAHLTCQNNTMNAMLADTQVIFVSNTFTTEKELKPYLKLASEFGYKVVSLVVENRHGFSSIHNVPEETLDKMEKRFSLKLRG